MMALVITALTIIAALGAGLIGGVFFAFSSFVMPALSARPAPESVAAMQSINVKVLNPSFFATFFGTALATLVIVVLAVVDGGHPDAMLRVIGSAAYLVGTLGVTIVCNVPRNQALAKIELDDPGTEGAWDSYNRGWTAWNTVRTLAAFVAGGALIGSLLQA